jgi:hypothetical protein
VNPFPNDGVDPHPLPQDMQQNQQFMPPVPELPNENNVEEEEGWGHWAVPQQNNNIQNQAAMPMEIENAALRNLLNVIEAEELAPGMDFDPPPNSSLTANAIFMVIALQMEMKICSLPREMMRSFKTWFVTFKVQVC